MTPIDAKQETPQDVVSNYHKVYFEIFHESKECPFSRLYKTLVLAIFVSTISGDLLKEAMASHVKMH